ncbi:hypothetical protein HLK59_10975 [Streptomyces sp. S3(2020)]|nr:hypothetical protein [Streptomyces sp. S3(2020)]NNN30881.1 hypothetical protein [Streptomyces sp. S3(2020)]
MAPEEPSGAVLVDQTMIADAARLLQNVPRGGGFVAYLADNGLDPLLTSQFVIRQRRAPVTNAERLADLSALCDALLLYDKLYVLRSETPPDAAGLELRTALIDLGVVEEIDVSAHGPAIAGELVAYLGATGGAAASPLLEDIAAAVRGSLADEEQPGAYSRTTSIVDAFRDGLEGHPLSGDRHAEDSLAAIVRPIVRDVGYYGSGAVLGAVSNIRTFVYWRLAARLGLPMYPSTRRLPSYRALTDHVDRSLRERAYGAVAEAFHTTVSEVYETEATVPVYLPPGAAIFLDTLRELRSVPDTLVSVRKRHEGLRTAFRKLQVNSAASRTLGELHRNRQRFTAVLAELRLPESATPGTLETSIDLLPDVVKAAANPLDVAGYGENLIRRPATWIQDWWRKRPYRLAFQLRDQLLEIANYQDLLQSATGVHISETELRAYAQLLEEDGHNPPGRRPGPISQVETVT